MPRHAKNNTALPFFTYEERQKLKYGSQEERLGRQSKRDFDACYLCLQMATDPVICPKGHLSCRGCVYECLLRQKTHMQKQREAYDRQTRELEAKEEEQKQLQIQESVRKFEATQSSLLPQRASLLAKSTSKGIRDDGKTVRDASNQRLYPQSGDSTAQIGKAQQPGKIEADDKSLVAFWIPGLTPSAEPTRLKPPTGKTCCLATDPPHALKLRQLVAVHFTPAGKERGSQSARHRDRNDRWQCPGCVKSLTNNSAMTVLTHCGHVLCQRCTTALILPSKTCLVCNAPVSPTNGTVVLVHEGTGFAGSGKVVVAKKYTTAFTA